MKIILIRFRVFFFKRNRQEEEKSSLLISEAVETEQVAIAFRYMRLSVLVVLLNTVILSWALRSLVARRLAQRRGLAGRPQCQRRTQFPPLQLLLKATGDPGAFPLLAELMQKGVSGRV